MHLCRAYKTKKNAPRNVHNKHENFRFSSLRKEQTIESLTAESSADRQMLHYFKQFPMKRRRYCNSQEIQRLQKADRKQNCSHKIASNK